MLKSVAYACRSPVCQNLLSPQSTNRGWYLYQWLESSVQKRNIFLLSHNCLLNNNTRNFVAKINKVKKNDEPIRFWRQNQESETLQKNNNIKKLISILGCSKKEARSLVENESELFVENFDSTITKVEFLISEGVTLYALQNNIWILHITLSRLQTYLRAMQLWDLDECHFQEFLLTLNETPKEFFFLSKKFIKDKITCPQGNRVIYFSNRLDYPVSELLPRMLRKKIMFLKSVGTMDEALNLFRGLSVVGKMLPTRSVLSWTFGFIIGKISEFGIKNEDILNDLSCLLGPVDVMRERLMRLQKIGYYPMKPWLARYENDKSERAIKFFLAEKEAQDYETREKFLAAQLKVEVEDITGLKQEMYRKYPYLFHIRPLTFMRKLKFLLNEGYFPRELINHPQAFYVKISTLKNRITALQKLGISKPHLPNVIKNDKTFEEFLQHVVADRGLEYEDKKYFDKNSNVMANSDFD